MKITVTQYTSQRKVLAPHLLPSEVKRQADIVAIASVLTKLRRSGSQWLGLCPLPDHAERHPSFYVHPRGVWYCFGCQRGGDVFRLVILAKSCSFPIALRFVADFIGNNEISLRAAKPPEVRAAKRPGIIARLVRAREERVTPIPIVDTDESLSSLGCAADFAWERESKGWLCCAVGP